MVPAPIREDPAGWAARLRISREAVEVWCASDVVDLHVDSFIWSRILGYDLGRAHTPHLPAARFFGHADIPRMRDAGLTGAVMSITTNPFRSRPARSKAFFANLARLRSELERAGAAVVANIDDYRAARALGRFACFVAIQGANAVSPEDVARPEFDAISRVTLVHLTRSRYGSTSAPGGGSAGGGLTPDGRDLVAALRERHILLDLAHASKATFAAALAAHGSDRPVVATHTGLTGVREIWRNLDDKQVRAIADTGGVVGVILQRSFLNRKARVATSEDVVDHIDRTIVVGGDDTPALGSDYDGMITPPRDLHSVLELPRIADAMLRRGYSPQRAAKVLGGNWLRVVEAVRPRS